MRVSAMRLKGTRKLSHSCKTGLLDFLFTSSTGLTRRLHSHPIVVSAATLDRPDANVCVLSRWRTAGEFLVRVGIAEPSHIEDTCQFEPESYCFSSAASAVLRRARSLKPAVRTDGKSRCTAAVPGSARPARPRRHCRHQGIR